MSRKGETRTIKIRVFDRERVWKNCGEVDEPKIGKGLVTCDKCDREMFARLYRPTFELDVTMDDQTGILERVRNDKDHILLTRVRCKVANLMSEIERNRPDAHVYEYIDNIGGQYNEDTLGGDFYVILYRKEVCTHKRGGENRTFKAPFPCVTFDPGKTDSFELTMDMEIHVRRKFIIVPIVSQLNDNGVVVCERGPLKEVRLEYNSVGVIKIREAYTSEAGNYELCVRRCVNDDERKIIRERGVKSDLLALRRSTNSIWSTMAEQTRNFDIGTLDFFYWNDGLFEKRLTLLNEMEMQKEKNLACSLMTFVDFVGELCHLMSAEEDDAERRMRQYMDCIRAANPYRSCPVNGNELKLLDTFMENKVDVVLDKINRLEKMRKTDLLVLDDIKKLVEHEMTKRRRIKSLTLKLLIRCVREVYERKNLDSLKSTYNLLQHVGLLTLESVAVVDVNGCVCLCVKNAGQETMLMMPYSSTRHLLLERNIPKEVKRKRRDGPTIFVDALNDPMRKRKTDKRVKVDQLSIVNLAKRSGSKLFRTRDVTMDECVLLEITSELLEIPENCARITMEGKGGVCVTLEEPKINGRAAAIEQINAIGANLRKKRVLQECEMRAETLIKKREVWSGGEKDALKELRWSNYDVPVVPARPVETQLNSADVEHALREWTTKGRERKSQEITNTKKLYSKNLIDTLRYIDQIVRAEVSEEKRTDKEEAIIETFHNRLRFAYMKIRKNQRTIEEHRVIIDEASKLLDNIIEISVELMMNKRYVTYRKIQTLLTAITSEVCRNGKSGGGSDTSGYKTQPFD